MNPRILIYSTALALCGYVTVTSAQTPSGPRVEFPSPSPGCTIKQRVGLTDIEVNYSRPGMKERKIFGGLVPYGEVWRTGANAATKISFSTDVTLNGTAIPAGKYALFTIPGEDEWTIILSKDTQGNPLNYKQENDLARFKAPSRKIGDHVESFTIEFTNVRDDSAAMYLLWDDTLVPIRIDMDVTSKLVPQIESVMSGSGSQKPYYQAAMFYYDHGLDMEKAHKWIDEAAKHETYYILNLKAKILAKVGDKEGAIAAAKRSSELAAKTEGASGYIKMNQDLISSLQ